MSIESSRASRLSSSVAHQRCPVCNAQRCHTCPRAVPNGWLPAGECSRRRRGTIERTLLWCDSCGCRTTLLRLLWLGLVCNGPGACGLKLPDNAFHAAFFGSGRSGGLLTWLDYIACPLHVQLFIRGWWTLEVHGKYEEIGSLKLGRHKDTVRSIMLYESIESHEQGTTTCRTDKMDVTRMLDPLICPGAWDRDFRLGRHTCSCSLQAA